MLACQRIRNHALRENTTALSADTPCAVVVNENKPKHRAPASTDCHADAELPYPLTDQIAHYAIKTGARNKKG
jgi:hypothetical protein